MYSPSPVCSAPDPLVVPESGRVLHWNRPSGTHTSGYSPSATAPLSPSILVVSPHGNVSQSEKVGRTHQPCNSTVLFARRKDAHVHCCVLVGVMQLCEVKGLTHCRSNRLTRLCEWVFRRRLTCPGVSFCDHDSQAVTVMTLRERLSAVTASTTYSKYNGNGKRCQMPQAGRVGSTQSPGQSHPGVHSVHSALCPAFQCALWHSLLQYETARHRAHCLYFPPVSSSS